MKFTKLSLVAALAVSAAFAGGDIEPVAAPVVAEFPQTTIGGKATAYYYSDDAADDMFGNDSSALGTAVTLDVTHKFNANIAANVTAIGFANVLDENLYAGIGGYFEQERSGAFINVANITANFADTTFVLGRQLLDTPMIGGFDWLLAPGAFEAYTAVNSSIENLTLVGTYIRTWRPNNSGTEFIDISNNGDDNNWAVGAAYSSSFSASAWYYNVDALGYSQVYVDGGYDFDVLKVAAQYVNTDWDFTDASNAYGAKVTATLGSFNLMGAYVLVDSNVVGYVGRDGLYTSSWNTLGLSQGDTFKVEAGTEFAGITASASYAYYEYEQYAATTDNNEGHEVDVILGYDMKDSALGLLSAIDLNLVYTNTNYGDDSSDINALEVYANYKF